jgi:hypothetical protein
MSATKVWPLTSFMVACGWEHNWPRTPTAASSSTNMLAGRHSSYFQSVTLYSPIPASVGPVSNLCMGAVCSSLAETSQNLTEVYDSSCSIVLFPFPFICVSLYHILKVLSVYFYFLSPLYFTDFPHTKKFFALLISSLHLLLRGPEFI